MHTSGYGDYPTCDDSKALNVLDGGKNVGMVFVSLEVCNDTFGVLPYVAGTAGHN